jgi:hypothetical protein
VWAADALWQIQVTAVAALILGFDGWLHVLCVWSESRRIRGKNWQIFARLCVIATFVSSAASRSAKILEWGSRDVNMYHILFGLTFESLVAFRMINGLDSIFQLVGREACLA